MAGCHFDGFIGCFWKNSHIRSFAEMSMVEGPSIATIGFWPGQVWPPPSIGEGGLRTNSKKRSRRVIIGLRQRAHSGYSSLPRGFCFDESDALLGSLDSIRANAQRLMG